MIKEHKKIMQRISQDKRTHEYGSSQGKTPRRQKSLISSYYSYSNVQQREREYNDLKSILTCQIEDLTSKLLGSMKLLLWILVRVWTQIASRTDVGNLGHWLGLLDSTFFSITVMYHNLISDIELWGSSSTIPSLQQSWISGKINNPKLMKAEEGWPCFQTLQTT